MSDLNQAIIDAIEEAMVESFTDGRLVTTTDGAPEDRVRIIGSLDLPESVVKKMLGDLYDGAVTDDAGRAARGSTFEMRDGGQIGSSEVDFDNQ